jgi:hypothetical protein
LPSAASTRAEQLPSAAMMHSRGNAGQHHEQIHVTMQLLVVTKQRTLLYDSGCLGTTGPVSMAIHPASADDGHTLIETDTAAAESQVAVIKYCDPSILLCLVSKGVDIIIICDDKHCSSSLRL